MTLRRPLAPLLAFLLVLGAAGAERPGELPDPHPCRECDFSDTTWVAYHLARDGAQRDPDGDGLGDLWTRGLAPYTSLLADAGDLDLDGLPLLREFRWNTLPFGPLPHPRTGEMMWENAPDFDADGWMDGPEMRWWNDPANDALLDDPRWRQASLAPRDPDATRDLDGDGLGPLHDVDADGDGLDDLEEMTLGALPDATDSDCAPAAPVCAGPGANRHDPRPGAPGTGDGLPDARERDLWRALLGDEGPLADCDGDGTPPLRDPDSDDDGLGDLEEFLPASGAFASSPCLADEDGDGLKDGDEAKHATDPRDADTDDDGMPDGWETRFGLAPRLAADARLDRDGDALANLDEHRRGADPTHPDTDRDTLLDGEEVARGLDATRWDTDGDRMPDGWEALHGLQPLADDADADEDADVGAGGAYAHANLDEYLLKRPHDWHEPAMGPWPGGTDPREPDTDADGVPDGEEVARGTDPRAPGVTVERDADADGLDTPTELRIGTRPARSDTDGDGLCDGGRGAECGHPRAPGGRGPGELLDYRTNPHHADTDADGLDDGREAGVFDAQGSGALPQDQAGRNPLQAPDFDADGVDDAEEIAAGTRPDVPDTDADALPDGEELLDLRWPGHAPDPRVADTDADGLPDGAEVRTHGTHPNLRDTDDDGLDDAEEARTGTSPLSPDTDRDGMPDGWERAYGLDPLADDADQDKDRDALALGLSNLQEFLLGTSPAARDTDGDGMDDLWEHALGLDPRADDRRLDSDADGLLNLAEYALGTSPHAPDTDDDGLGDAWEAWNGGLPLAAPGLTRSDPLAHDTDADGLDDGRELDLWDAQGAGAWSRDADGDGGPLAHLAHNLRDADADNDGLDDGQERLLTRTRPDRADTDDDGDDDRSEIMTLGTDPRDARSHRGTAAAQGPGLDADADGLSDAAERDTYGTDPARRDTDDDGVPDGAERIAWGDEWAHDHDGDGLPSLRDPDADDDGLRDALEFATAGLDRRRFYVTSPRHADTDEDGLPDGREDDNGVAGEAAAQGQGRPRPALPSSPAAPRANAGPERAPIPGAYGLWLTPTRDEPGRRDPTPAAAPASSAKSSPDRADTDRDGLHDGEEARRGTDWNERDSDGDTLSDRDEPHADPDRDGLVNALDPDADNDGLRDGDERLLHLDPYDADGDDDALCDGEEAAAGAPSSPHDADTDHDGLSDGLETRRAGPCLTAGGVGGWTHPAPLGLTHRTTFQPWLGPAGAPPTQPGTGLLPVEVPDFDRDGVLDGLEDWNTDGRLDEDEMDPFENDKDGDGLSDGVEIRVWGADTMTFASFLKHHGGSAEAAKRAVTYSREDDWLKTDPRAKDTDADGIMDGHDINPNGKLPPVISLVFDTFSMLDPIDPFRSYSPEPYFDITIETAAGDVTVKTPVLPEVELQGPIDSVALSEVLSGDAFRSVLLDGTMQGALASAEGGILKVSLPENAATYGPASRAGTQGSLLEILVTVHMGDGDCYALAGCTKEDSDVIDVGASVDEVVYRAKVTLGVATLDSVGVPSGRRHLLPPGDGSMDGASSWSNPSNADDDGRLTVMVEDKVWKPFAQNALSLTSGSSSVVLPPTGQGWG